MNCSCASGSPLPTHLARPFRIMWTASIPCNVRQAVENDWYLLANHQYSFSRGGALGWGMPAAIGFSLGLDRGPVVAIVGDCAALYSPQAIGPPLTKSCR